MLSLFVGNKDQFVTGVTNKHGIGDAESFMYYNVCPKLQIRGLTINEKVVSVQWRRFAVIKMGSKFLAYIERKSLKSKPKNESTASKKEVAAGSKSKTRASPKKK